MATIIIEVDQKQAVQALRQLNRSIAQTAKNAEDSFDKAGISIGVVGGVVGALTEKFLELAAAAAKAFAQVISDSVKLASQLEQAQVTFTNIFGGDAGAAEAFLGNLNQQALELGVNFSDLAGFAKSLAPDTESVAQFERLTQAAVTLEKSDPDKTFEDVRIAIEGALSGDFVSLQDRFDLPRTTVARIKELQGELGTVEGIIAGLEEEFERTGQNLESFGDTFAASQSRIEARFDTLKTSLGEPILESLREEFSLFDELLAENSDEIQLFAQQLGDVVASVVDFIGTGINDFLADLDFSKFQDLGDSFFRLIESGRLIVDLLFDVDEATPNERVDDLTSAFDTLTSALNTAAQGLALIKATLAEAGAAAKNVATIFQLATGQITSEEAFTSFVDGNEAFNESIAKSVSTIESSNERIRENKRLQVERRAELEADTSAELNRADAILRGKNAAKEAEEAAREAAEAQAQIDEKQADLAEDLQKRRTDIARREGQKRIDDEIKNAQKREDIARDNVEAIEDIFRKQGQAITDAATDLSRDEEDIARKAARDRSKIEVDAANERLDVERNFRQELNSIQNQFNQDAADAERNNDAQAFLRAQRARDDQIQAATQERDTSLEDVDRNAAEQRESLNTQLAQEVEDAKIANSRKLEDLQLRLERELEAQAIKNERDLEQQTLFEERQRQQRDLAAQRELEGFNRLQEEKQAKLNESLEAQFAALEAAQQKEIALLEQSEAEKTAIVAAGVAERGSLPTNASTDAVVASMAAGSAIGAGQSAVVGEMGPEVFTPSQSGIIIPNETMFSPPSTLAGTGSNVDNSRSLNVGQIGINPGDAVISRMVQNEVTRLLELI